MESMISTKLEGGGAGSGGGGNEIGDYKVTDNDVLPDGKRLIIPNGSVVDSAEYPILAQKTPISTNNVSDVFLGSCHFMYNIGGNVDNGNVMGMSVRSNNSSIHKWTVEGDFVPIGQVAFSLSFMCRGIVGSSDGETLILFADCTNKIEWTVTQNQGTTLGPIRGYGAVGVASGSPDAIACHSTGTSFLIAVQCCDGPVSGILKSTDLVTASIIHRFSSNGIVSLDASDDLQTILVFVQNETVELSKDGGVTFVSVPLLGPFSTHPKLLCKVSADGQKMIIADTEKCRIQYTSNGGDDWSEFSTPNMYHNLNGTYTRLTNVTMAKESGSIHISYIHQKNSNNNSLTQIVAATHNAGKTWSQALISTPINAINKGWLLTSRDGLEVINLCSTTTNTSNVHYFSYAAGKFLPDLTEERLPWKLIADAQAI
jgi:hypothetical protein